MTLPRIFRLLVEGPKIPRRLVQCSRNAPYQRRIYSSICPRYPLLNVLDLGRLEVLSDSDFISRQIPITGRVQYVSCLTTRVEKKYTRFCEDLEGGARMILEPDHPISTAVRDIMNEVLKGELAQRYHGDLTPIHIYERFDQPEAYAMGSQVFISTCILLRCHSPAQVASILAHEIAHIMCNHTAEAETARILPKLVAQCDGRYKDVLELKRAQEMEADHIGLMLSAAAGFDPRETVDLLVRWATDERHYGTESEECRHPTWAKRLASAVRLSPEAKSVFHKTRIFRPVIKDIMEWAKIRGLVTDLRDEKITKTEA